MAEVTNGRRCRGSLKATFHIAAPQPPSRRIAARPQERGDYARPPPRRSSPRRPLVYAAFIVERRIWPLQTSFDWNHSRNLKGMQNPPVEMIIETQVLSSPHSTPLDDRLSSDDDGTHGGGKEEGKRTFPSSKDVVYTLLPRLDINEEVLDFEGGGVGVGDSPPT
ncbi:hypothetical protein K523DRAFT_356785 [Schizophyllum commune Tattone D]|nr:hypothetical protein K523DRAFT_356785 [Schizophyllum commune Tattone D]